MEGKLIKTSIDSYHNGHYFLNDSDGFAIGSTDKDWCKRAVSKRPLYILSLKNCETIENGYDLDELAYGCDLYEKMNFVGQMSAFKLGFQKALEILGDKKFSEKELTMLFAYGHQIGMNDVLAIQSQHSPQPMPKPDSDKLRDELIQSLQQTEWDVIIEMECPECKEYGYVYECRNKCNKKFLQPKLDTDGCLILRRI